MQSFNLGASSSLISTLSYRSGIVVSFVMMSRSIQEYFFSSMKLWLLSGVIMDLDFLTPISAICAADLLHTPHDLDVDGLSTQSITDVLPEDSDSNLGPVI